MRNFICGMIAYMAINSLYQDWIGKEAYIIFCQTKWIPAEKTVPFALCLLTLAIVGAKYKE